MLERFLEKRRQLTYSVQSHTRTVTDRQLTKGGKPHTKTVTNRPKEEEGSLTADTGGKPDTRRVTDNQTTKGVQPVSTHIGWVAHVAVAVVCCQTALLVPVGDEVVVKAGEGKGGSDGGMLGPSTRHPAHNTPHISCVYVTLHTTLHNSAMYTSPFTHIVLCHSAHNITHIIPVSPCTQHYTHHPCVTLHTSSLCHPAHTTIHIIPVSP